MPQVIRSPKVYDVCIIGSGAAGGTAAKVLTAGGLSVVMLEAGPPLNPDKDYKEHVWPYELDHRGVGVGARFKGELNDEFLAPNGAWEIEGEPYTSAPGSRFRWFRSRIVGGRTNHWGRIALRFAPADFRARSTDGMGDDWPITYEEIAPYYDKVESYIGVFGTKENIPSAPDGIFQPPPKPRCTESVVKKACDKLNILCVPSRLAILTQPLNGRAACHYCAQCGRGCLTASNFSSSQVMIPAAQKTGRFTLITNAMAREIVVGKDGKPVPNLKATDFELYDEGKLQPIVGFDLIDLNRTTAAGQEAAELPASARRSSAVSSRTSRAAWPAVRRAARRLRSRRR